MKIRKETAEDIEAVFKINISAFPNEEEAQLVNRLRETVSPLISLVAEGEQEIIGHILFTPVTLDSDTNLFLMGLAPMAVNPPTQNKGIGSQLVRAGLEECRALGAVGAVVLGHPEYYLRFGFSPSMNFGIKSKYDVPREVFMVLELSPHVFADKEGVISYHPAFAGL
ncbi:MAG: N-acetyltransferase [Pseudomonadota bacterium]|nr:N-acetyltransferase [Pseudomonadota bacterium]